MGALPVGDDAGDAHPAPMLLIRQVGCTEHAVVGQYGAQQLQGRALRGHSGQAQVSCLALTVGHDRQGRGLGADSGSRKRGLIPRALPPARGATTSAVLIGEDSGSPQGLTALHP